MYMGQFLCSHTDQRIERKKENAVMGIGSQSIGCPIQSVSLLLVYMYFELHGLCTTSLNRLRVMNRTSCYVLHNSTRDTIPLSTPTSVLSKPAIELCNGNLQCFRTYMYCRIFCANFEDFFGDKTHYQCNDVVIV